MFSHATRLRWSGQVNGYGIDIAGLVELSTPVGVPGGAELIRLVDVFFEDSEEEKPVARQAVIDALGPESFFDAATVLGNFEMMNRVAEGTGIPIPPQAVDREAQLMKILGLYDILKSQQHQASSLD